MESPYYYLCRKHAIFVPICVKQIKRTVGPQREIAAVDRSTYDKMKYSDFHILIGILLVFIPGAVLFVIYR